jgi:7,8-dihydro-6-hydroxymethylpterin-pyrophosphokinase
VCSAVDVLNRYNLLSNDLRAAMAKYYESDITLMMRDLLKQNPHIEEEQKKGRGLWWDKKLDLDMLRRTALSKVPQQAYVYQTETAQD